MRTALFLLATAMLQFIVRKLRGGGTMPKEPSAIERIRSGYFAVFCLLSALAFSVDLWIALAPAIGQIVQAVVLALIVAVIVATNIHVELERSKGGQ